MFFKSHILSIKSFILLCAWNNFINIRMFLDEMGWQSCHHQRRESIALDAGYVSYRPVTTVGLQGKKLLCVISVISSLFIISLINLTVRECNEIDRVETKIVLVFDLGYVST